MLKHILQKIKFFLTTKPRLGKFSLIILVVFVAIGVFGMVQPVYAGIDDWIADVLSNVFLYIASFLGQLVALVIGLLIDITQYNDFTNAAAVETGWVVLRDLSNMLFVLVLLVIAFGTILKLENYKYNRLLGKLIIMIVLVNFSKMIAGFFIDISQVVMMTFVNAFSDTVAANFTNALQLKQMLGFIGERAPTALEPLEKIGVSLFAVILLVIALMTMLAMVVVFLVRIVALWILVVLSPFAYLLNVLPTTQQYASQWWSHFMKWTTTGPILAFFIWLALTIMSGGQSLMNTNAEGQVIDTAGGKLAGSISEVSKSENVLAFMIAIAMFVISLSIASKLGTIAGAFAAKMSGKITALGAKPLSMAGRVAGAPLKGGWELAKMGGRRVRREWQERAPGWLNVPSLYRGAKARGKELDEQAKVVADARGREAWEAKKGWLRLRPGAKVEIPHEERVEAEFEARYAKDFAHMTKEQKAHQAMVLEKVGGAEGRRRRRALIRVAAEGGHLDDIMAAPHFRERYQDKKTGEFYNYQKLHQFLNDYIGDHEQGQRTIYDLEEIGKRVRHQEYGGHNIVDETTGKYKWQGIPEATNKAISELTKVTGRTLLGDSPHDFAGIRIVPVYDPVTHKPIEGMTKVRSGSMDEFNRKAFMRAFRTQPETRIVEHTQSRTANYLLGDEKDFDSEGRLMGDSVDEERIRTMYGEWDKALTGFWQKIGGEGTFKFYNVETGKTITLDDLGIGEIIKKQGEYKGPQGTAEQIARNDYVRGLNYYEIPGEIEKLGSGESLPETAGSVFEEIVDSAMKRLKWTGHWMKNIREGNIIASGIRPLLKEIQQYKNNKIEVGSPREAKLHEDLMEFYDRASEGRLHEYAAESPYAKKGTKEPSKPGEEKVEPKKAPEEPAKGPTPETGEPKGEAKDISDHEDVKNALAKFDKTQSQLDDLMKKDSVDLTGFTEALRFFEDNVKEITDSLKKAAGDLGKRDKTSTRAFQQQLDKARDIINQGSQPGAVTTPEQQYNFVYNMKLIIKELRKLTGEKGGKPGPAPH